MLQKINHSIFEEKSTELFLLRLDLLNGEWGGNKWFKLKYHIEDALKNNCTTIASFGGTYSNHLAALAAYGKANHLNTIGYVKLQGAIENYPTLIASQKNGMKIIALDNSQFANLQQKYSQQYFDANENIYFVPAGAHSALGVKGCEEILQNAPTINYADFTHIFTSVGYGTTLAGIINSSISNQKIIGITSVKKIDSIKIDVEKFSTKNNWEILSLYHFGGFAKINEELLAFMNEFHQNYQVELDRVYNSKTLFAVFDLVKKNYFNQQSKILAIHTGGLQGNKSLV